MVLVRILFTLIISLVVFAPTSATFTFAAESSVNKQTVQLDHKPVHVVQAGEPANVSADITDNQGVQEARLYFKTMNSNRYLFVLMADTGEGSYRAAIPPVRNGVAGIDYRILIMNNTGQGYLSKIYRILVQSNYARAKQKHDPIPAHIEPLALPPDTKEYSPKLDITVKGPALLAETEDYLHPKGSIPGPGNQNRAQGFINNFGGSFYFSSGSFSISIQ